MSATRRRDEDDRCLVVTRKELLQHTHNIGPISPVNIYEKMNEVSGKQGAFDEPMNRGAEINIYI